MNLHRVLFGFRAAFILGAAFALASAPALADDIFSVGGIKVDATGASATEARDIAIAQGRPIAWAKLYHRLTREKDWSRQPQLDDATLSKMIRGFEIANEKHSSTRYLAEMTYDFRAADVRSVLQRAGVAYTEATGKRALVIPILAARPFEPAGAWTQAWAKSDLANSIVPMVLPEGNPADLDVLSRSDLTQLGWAAFSPLAARYGASEVIVAEATSAPGAVTVRLVRILPSGSTSVTLAAQPGYAAAATAATIGMREAWKERSVVDYGQRSKLVAFVSFSSGREWISIRSRLALIPTVADVNVVGLTVNNAEIELFYIGQLAQLQDALAQQNLTLNMGQGAYSLRSVASADNP